MNVDEITVEELNKRLEDGENLFILDVREPHEFELVNLNGTLIPLGQLPDRLDEIESVKDQEVIVHCRSGVRSADACKIMMAAGFKNPRNLAGGIIRWANVIDPTMPVY